MKPDGGPAFPQPWSKDMGWAPTASPMGMTLRDYLAARAMAALGDPSCQVDNPAAFAKWCYAIADAMLTEREKP